MNRSNYTDDPGDGGAHAMWRGQVASAIRGKRGQTLIKDLCEAMDAMPIKELIEEALVADGSYCALGVVGHARGVDMSEIDPEDIDAVAKALNIAAPMVREIAFVNDDGGCYDEMPAKRWGRMREWALQNTKPNRRQG